MVSTQTKAKYVMGKTGKAAKLILPIFSKENVSDFTNEILREDEELRRRVIMNPEYRNLLEQKVTDTFKQYRGVLKGAKLVDSWDRVIGATRELGDAAGIFSEGLGYLISGAENVIDLIPKAVYGVYYGIKTKDLKALPYWTAAEAASFVPYLGEAIDMMNIYVNRARKITKEKVKKDMRKITESKLEKEVIQESA